MGYRRTIHHPGQVARYRNLGNLFPIRVLRCSAGFAALFGRRYWKSMASTQGQCTVRKLLKLWQIDPSTYSQPPLHSYILLRPMWRKLTCGPLKKKMVFRWMSYQLSGVICSMVLPLGGASKCQSEARAGTWAGKYWRSNKSTGRLPGSLFL